MTSALVRTVTTLPRRLLPHTLALAAAACSGSGSSAPPPPTLAIAKAATASGDGQTDSVLTTLPNPLRVSVTLGGTPHAGDAVTWATTGAGSSVTPRQSLTDANGVGGDDVAARPRRGRPERHGDPQRCHGVARVVR